MAANIIEETIVSRGWSVLRRNALQMPDDAIVERHIECHGKAAAVLSYDPIPAKCLSRQHASGACH